MWSNEMALTVGGPGDRPVPGCRPSLFMGNRKAHTHGTGRKRPQRAPASSPGSLTGSNGSRALSAPQPQGKEHSKRSPAPPPRPRVELNRDAVWELLDRCGRCGRP